MADEEPVEEESIVEEVVAAAALAWLLAARKRRPVDPDDETETRALREIAAWPCASLGDSSIKLLATFPLGNSRNSIEAISPSTAKATSPLLVMAMGPGRRSTFDSMGSPKTLYTPLWESETPTTTI